MAAKFLPSPQQAGFFSWITDDTGSCVLEAVAGAGKTTTLIQALTLMKGSVFFGAYNKKIAEEIKARAPERAGLTISTMHAAGFGAWRRGARTVKVEADKVNKIFKAACERTQEYAPFYSVVIELVSLAKQAGIGAPGFPGIASRQAWLDLVDHYDVETFDEDGADNTELIIKLAIKTLKASIMLDHEVIDFNDMIYSPLYHSSSIEKFDWVLVDEAQDTNATRRALALKMLKPNGRLVAVGDKHQAIYGFTGADNDALDLIAAATNAKSLPLTTTFRCPKAVVQYAQRWVSHIHAADTAPTGSVESVEIDKLLNVARIGDVILCRYNAPLLENVYKFIAAGVPAKVEGREIGKGLIALAQRWKVGSLSALQDRLESYLEREVAKYTAKEQPAKVTATEDKVNCLNVIINRVRLKDPHTAQPVAAVVAEIESIFSDNNDTSKVVLLSSIHKSKGREWQRVVWLQTGPNKRAKLQWQLEQEDNLCYVAATRSMSELVLVNIAKGE